MPDSEQVGTIHPTVYIGLGGTGKEVLLRLRRRFYERWGKPSLECTRFLWFDTDSRDVWAKGEEMRQMDLELKFEDGREAVSLLTGKVGEAYGRFLRSKKQFKYIHDWLHPEVDVFGADITDGAGGIRAIGRLAFFSQVTSIETKLKEAVNLVTEDVIQRTRKLLPNSIFDPQVQVYVIFSVAGGTGGGIFLDMAFMLRKLALEGLPIERIIGVMALPNVYFMDTLDERAHRSHGSAYSALKELEYYSRRIRAQSSEGDDESSTVDFRVEWEPGYPDRPIMGPPFGTLYVFEMFNEFPVRASDRVELFEMTSDWLLLNFLPGPFTQQKTTEFANIKPLLAGAVKNEISVGDSILSQLYSRRYAAFGMSKIEVPIESVREACACRLASRLLEYWNRPPSNPDIRGTLEKQVRGRFDAEGLEALYGTDWRNKIDMELGALLPEAQQLPTDEGGDESPLVKFIQDLPEKLQATERKLFSDVGPGPGQWGDVVQIIRNKTRNMTPSVVDDLRRKLDTWVTECIEREDLGINTLLADGGLLQLLLDTFKKFCKDEPSGASLRKKEALDEAGNMRTWRDYYLAELRYAVRSWGVRLLGMKGWTVEEIYSRFRQVAFRWAYNLAGATLAREAAVIAEEGMLYLTKQRQQQLRDFREATENVADRLRNLEKEYLDPSRSSLSVTIFDASKDFDKFYVLKYDPQRRVHQEVKIEGEQGQHKLFLGKTLGAGSTLLSLVDSFGKLGEKGLEKLLQDYTTRLFKDAFQTCLHGEDEEHRRNCGRLLKVLEHEYFKTHREEIIERFVRSALPLLRRGKYVGGKAVKETKILCLGVAAQDTLNDEFVDQVRKRLQAHGFGEYGVNVQYTGDPTHVYLLIETYAFPISCSTFVTQDLHKAYYDFYKLLRGKTKFKRDEDNIPLHLCSTWEGEFDDLQPLDERAAESIHEILQILAVGPILRVIRVIPKDGHREYGYGKFEPPQVLTRELGNKRQAVEAIQADRELRQRLLKEIATRHERIKLAATATDPTSLSYYWALSYVNYRLFVPGSIEHSIVGARLADIYNYLRSNKGTELRVFGEGESSEDILKYCTEQLKIGVDWVADFPVLKSIEPLVLGRD